MANLNEAADLAKTMAQYLLENPLQASTPDLQAKQARLLRLLTGDSSTEPQDDSTGSAPSASPTPGGKLPQQQGESEMNMEGEEHGILAEKQRRERVRQMAKQAQRSPGTR